MKLMTLLLVMVMMAPVAAAQASPAEAFKVMQAKVQEKKLPEAIAEAEKMLSRSDLPSNEKVRFLRAAAEATAKLGGAAAIPDAIALQERIVADDAIPNPAKIEAIKGIADLQIASQQGRPLHEMDLAPAHETLRRAQSLPDLKPHDQAAALKNTGKLHERAADYDKARQTYEQILSLDVHDGVKKEAYRLIAGTLAAQEKHNEAIAMFRQHGLDLIDGYALIADDKGRYDACMRVLRDASAPDHLRWAAFTKLPCWDWRSDDLEAVRAACEQFLPGLIEKEPNRAQVLQRKFMDHGVKSSPAFVEWAGPILAAAPKLPDVEYVKVQSARVDALAAQGKVPQAIDMATAMAADARVPATAQLWAKLVAATLAAPAEVEPIVAGAPGVTPAEKAEALLGAARTALRAANEPSARALLADYDAMFPKPEQATTACAFIADAPYDIGTWLASPLVADARRAAKLDRPYGDNLQFLLETDSAVTGRNANAGAQESTGDSETELYAACDELGIHLFLHAHDARATEVAAGLVSGGSFEMYFAPGPHQAYHTFLIDLPQGGVDPKGFITMYPNALFRLPSIEEGTIRTQTRRTAKGFATHLFLSWELFYDKLPANGATWELEAIRWTRSGGFSFGGSESVHNRSSFGRIVFSGLGDEQRSAIQRHILYRALAQYKKAKSSTGPVGGWADPVLGDPVFFNEKVRPMLERLDAHAAKVTKDLAPADVELLYRDAVPGWMEAPFRVQAMRAQYLQDKLLNAR